MQYTQTRFVPLRLSFASISIGLPVVLFVILGLLWGFNALKQESYTNLREESANLLSLFTTRLDGELAKLEYLPALVARDQRVLHALNTRNAIDVNQVNRYLSTVANTSGASDVYLMDIDGLTIAASNFLLERSFVGRNFSFRPYFQQAVQGYAGRYYALGTTSLARGYYFSHPVYEGATVRGVVVAKLTLGDVESAWADRGTQFIVTDEDGVIFLTTRRSWLYKSIYSLDATRLKKIEESRRYVGQAVESLPMVEHETGPADVRLVAVDNDTGKPSTYLWQTVQAPRAGWEIHALADIKGVHGPLLMRTTLVGLGLLTVVLLVTLYIFNRRRRLELQGAAELLENRVRQRTAELEIEVEERKRAEDDLRDTQEELIQAAKMAGLGEISAGISHELNQPLTAIRTYAENAQKMLGRGQSNRASTNLDEITELTTRMSRIITLLRGFSRKSIGERTRLSLSEAIQQALDMFNRQIEREEIELNVNIESALSVVTDPVLLNQVLVNLISNAIHAMAESESRVLTIGAHGVSGGISISVRDTGTGIPPDVLENVFDPFFTTKEVGLGLGLGLSISFRIMQRLEGRIDVSSVPREGAEFRIFVPEPEA